MDVVAKLIRLLQDDYKVGAEMHAGKPILYLDPNKIDTWRIENDLARKDNQAVVSQLAEQLDAQYPGLSQKFSTQELAFMTKDSLASGPFARHINKTDSPICLINEAVGDILKAHKILETFGISTKFNPQHLNRIPGNDAQWKQLIGEHEGEHCNQEEVSNFDMDADIKMMDGEIRSDRAAIQTLLNEGHDDVVAAWKAIRAVAAANGDYIHATSIFFDDPDFDGATKEHLQAAKTFREEMSMGVAANLGISVIDAMSLRTDDPQKYANAVEDALQKKQIPAPRDATENEIKLLAAKKLGVDTKDIGHSFDKPANEIYAAYQAVKAEGGLISHGPDNPHINKYIESYVEATRILFIKDTIPILKSENSPAPPLPPVETTPELTAEDLEKRTTEELRQDAHIEASSIMDDVVKKSLGLSDEQLTELWTNNPDKFYKTVEDELNQGNIPLQTKERLGPEETDKAVAKKLGIPEKDVAALPYFVANKAIEELDRDGLMTNKRDNPQLKSIIEERIHVHHLNKPDIDAAPGNADAEPVAANSSKYNYLMAAGKNDGNGIPQIDLRSEDKGQMKIGCMSACEYFATKADPVLAAQAIKPVQGSEINDPALQQKVASNATSYLSNGTNGLA